MSRNLFLQLIFPGWMLRWGTPLMRRFYVAQHELQVRPCLALPSLLPSSPPPLPPRPVSLLLYRNAHANPWTSHVGLEQRYMHEMIAARRAADVKEERHDLFSSLLDANEGLTESGEKLSDGGLFGNVFVFMIAGERCGLLPLSRSVLSCACAY